MIFPRIIYKKASGELSLKIVDHEKGICNDLYLLNVVKKESVIAMVYISQDNTETLKDEDVLKFLQS